MPPHLSPTRLRAALAAALALACLARPAAGQPAGDRPELKLKAPVPHQVIQRDSRGLGEITVTAPDAFKDKAEISSLTLWVPRPDGGRQPVHGVRYNGAKIDHIPAGGPYGVAVEYKSDSQGYLLDAFPVFVGDLWVLAGQSNMEGHGKLDVVVAPDDRVMCLGMDGNWTRAEEPLHWLVDSPDPVHSGDPSTRSQRSAALHAGRESGAGLGLPFARVMAEETGVPVGLVACAHGGTSMEQWSPSKKGEGGKSLYGSMLRQVALAGGRVKGVLWYQGESDANEKAASVYARTFVDFIGAVRGDLGQPDLPFYFVQIGRFTHEGDPKPWNAVQEAQRRLPDEVPNTAVVAAVDLPLDDLIHVGTPGLERLGIRLAGVALREQGEMGASTPNLDRVSRGPDNTLVVKFKGVNRAEQDGEVTGLTPRRHVAGFSIRTADGKEIPLIFDARVAPSLDAVILKLIGKVPEGASLWYGWGYDPYCNLVDALDMAVPVFGPIALDGPK